MSGEIVEGEHSAARAAALALDCSMATAQIETFLRETVRKLGRRGCVLGVSGGIDSAVCVSLAVRALGPERVVALLMPERDSSKDGEVRARALCDGLGVRQVTEDITAALDAIGCYRHRDTAIRALFPDYGDGWRQKIAAKGVKGWTPHFNLIVQNPAGELFEQRMPVETYLKVVAAQNYKQRIRKNIEYYYAESLNYAVIGTPNRLEYELGFFVRGGDGLADLKPIAHLYKTQVYALAKYLDVPEEIRRQAPSTDTYSLPQSQEEFYFSVPYGDADLILYGMSNGWDSRAIAGALGAPQGRVEHVMQDFARKRVIAARALSAARVVDEHLLPEQQVAGRQDGAAG